MTSAEMAACMLDASSRAALHELFARWRQQYSDQELLELAERLKSEQCDAYLGNDLHAARRLAVGLTLLGRDTRLPYITGLGLLAQGDAARRSGRLGAAMARFDRAGEIFRAAGSPVGWARARGGWVAAAS